MNGGLEKINDATNADAESMFLDCCGSIEWARRMTESRPFSSESALFESAAKIWNSLRSSDWLEAFAAHPRIGERKAATSQQERSAEWSSSEQAGVDSGDDVTRQDLARANQEYIDKFGFIFIVCATGKSAREMLELCRARSGNDRDTEVEIAAKEQQKITEIRLQKLLSL